MIILAFDAGNTTGWALYADGEFSTGKIANEQVSKGNRNRGATYDFILDRVWTPDALAYEQFVVRQPVKEDHLDVMYINGAIESAAHRWNIPFYRYTPRQSKSRVSDDTLKELGWWPGFGLRTGGHCADAARILVCTLTDHYPEELMHG